MPQSRRIRNSNQEILLFTEPLTLPEGYDLDRAKAAAKRRDAIVREHAKQRDLRLGDVALATEEHERLKHIAHPKRIASFKKRTDGLFVPKNGTEKSAVTTIPIVKAETGKAIAAERVHAKYEGDESVSTRQVNLWAYFASQKAHQEIRKNYRTFRNESAINAARIGLHVAQNGGEIKRDLFRYDPEYRIDSNSHSVDQGVLAYNSVLKYTMALEAYAVLDISVLGKEGTPKWPRYDHRHDLRRRMDRANGQLEGLAEDLFAERVDEAYWSHYSRTRFWTGVNNEHDRFLKERRKVTVLPDVPPMELYMNDIEYALETSHLPYPVTVDNP